MNEEDIIRMFSGQIYRAALLRLMAQGRESSRANIEEASSEIMASMITKSLKELSG